MAASRIAGPLTPLWARLPAPYPQIIPSLVALLPQVADAFKTDVNTWESFAVSVATAIGLILPGITSKPKSLPEQVLDPDITRRIGPLVVLLVALAAVSQQACSGNTPPPKTGCSDEAFAGLTVECAAAAAKCVADGGAEETCGEICDSRAENWSASCR